MLCVAGIPSPTRGTSPTLRPKAYPPCARGRDDYLAAILLKLKAATFSRDGARCSFPKVVGEILPAEANSISVDASSIEGGGGGGSGLGWAVRGVARRLRLRGCSCCAL